MICKVIRRLFLFCGRMRSCTALHVAAIVLSALVIPFGNRTFAQEKSGGVYRSDIDSLLTIEKVTVLPFTDNLQGIYARPLEAHFISLVDKAHRWNYIPANNSGMILSPEELEADVPKALQVGQGLGVDAFFAGRVTKGPNGITIHISFFLAKDGKLLSQAILKDYKQFNINDLKEQCARLLSEIVSRLPYAGRVMSREGNRVTVNLGQRDGLQVGQVLSVIQIIQAQRHPKFNFLVSTEKEIFGRLKVLKVDETLSFATVLTEKERGAIQKNAKIGPLDFVVYSGGEDLALSGRAEDALGNREDGKVAFGKDAREWKPQNPPSWGQVGGRVGLGRVQENMDLTGIGPMGASDNIAPSIFLEGELWITPELTFHARLRQGLISVNNPRGGSSPGTLNQSLTSYEAGFGYMFRFGPYVWSPHVEPFLGYFSSRLYTDSTNPPTFTTVEYSGFKMGVRGSTLIGLGAEWGGGGEVAFAFRPGLRETPYASGDSSTNSVVQFGVFGFKKMGERIKARVNIDFEMYSSSFSGTSAVQTATSYSQRLTTLSGGIDYMF